MKMRFRLAAVLASFCVVAPAVRADDPPGKMLDEAAKRYEIAKQALKVNVDGALARAGKLPADLALIALETAESDVRDAAYLSPAERKAFLDSIEQKKKFLSLNTRPNTDSSTMPRAPRG